MKLYNSFNTLDEITFDQAIFSDKLYRKISNLDNTYSVYELIFKNNHFVWEKIYNFKLSEGYECIPFNNLVFHKGANRAGLLDSNNCITIYMCPTDGIATKEMIYKGDNLLIWNMFSPNMELDPNLNTDSLLNLPTHTDLVQESHNNYSEECQTDNYELIDNFIENFEPLHGWDNLLERSSDTETEEKIILDNDLEKDVDIPDNFIYPDMDDEDYSIKDNITEIDDDEEYRIDPYNGRFYSHSEFIDYYGGEVEWNFMDNKKFLLREEYYKFTNTFCHLSDKKFIFLFNEFQKTYE